MNPHPNEHEPLLAALLAGERSAEEPEIVQRLGACATCRERHARLASTVAAVVRAAEARCSVLEEARGATGAPGEQSVLATLERVSATAPAHRRLPTPWVWAAAAALFLVGGAWWFTRSRNPADASNPQRPIQLGAQGLELLHPKEGVASYDSFSWKYAEGVPDSYTLSIYAADDEVRSHPLVERRGLRQTTWTPDAEQLESLPDRILWRVDALDEFQALLPSGSASVFASRSPH